MFFYPRALCPVLLLPLLLGGALSGEVTAQPAAQSSAPEEERDRPTGEPEELPELIPEQTIPWHDSLVELPLWMNQERMEIESRTRPANQGGGLFPPEVWPLQPGPELAPLVRDDQPVAAPPPEPGQEPVTLGPELMALYTARPPAGVFIDPQHLVQGRSSGVMESLVQRWLNDQCPFRTTVLVFGAGQQLPADFDPQALRRQWFPDSPAALLVFYFHHQPERTLAIFGSEARGTYGEGVVRSVVDAAVTEAGRVREARSSWNGFVIKCRSACTGWRSPMKRGWRNWRPPAACIRKPPGSSFTPCCWREAGQPPPWDWGWQDGRGGGTAVGRGSVLWPGRSSSPTGRSLPGWGPRTVAGFRP